MRSMVVSFIIFSFILICLSIAALIVNSDLQQAVDFTSCNTQNIVNEAYNGNDNDTIPWSGLQNFGDDINLFAINIQNVVPDLSVFFSNATTLYQ